jgi:hypothetical protein
MSAHPVEIFCDYRILEEFFRGSLKIIILERKKRRNKCRFFINVEWPLAALFAVNRDTQGLAVMPCKITLSKMVQITVGKQTVKQQKGSNDGKSLIKHGRSSCLRASRH